MLDLSGPDVWPSTIAKVGEWSRQPCVREGFLTLFDAACLMAAEGYGGIFETCSKATQNEILGLNEALERSVDDRRALEGYLPVNRFVNGEYQDVYPLIAFKHWAERTGYGDGRYFAKAAAPGGSAPRECQDFCVWGGYSRGSPTRLPFVFEMQYARPDAIAGAKVEGPARSAGGSSLAPAIARREAAGALAREV